MRFLSLFALFVTCCYTANGGNELARLGYGFGKIIIIEGKMVDDQDTKMRRDMGRKLIEVSGVNGKPLEKKLIVPVETFPFADTKLPIRGTNVQLRGYETGHYRGIPEEAFKDIPLVANDGFYFESYFIATAVVSSLNVEPNGPANGSQPSRSQTNSTPSSAGSRR